MTALGGPSSETVARVQPTVPGVAVGCHGVCAGVADWPDDAVGSTLLGESNGTDGPHADRGNTSPTAKRRRKDLGVAGTSKAERVGVRSLRSLARVKIVGALVSSSD